MMQRVVILGCGGAGKSTLARQLGARTGLPIVHLDRIFWRAGWINCSREAFEAEHEAALAADEWIIDGNYNRTIPRRVERADTVVVLDLPRWQCVAGAVLRFVKGRYFGAERSDMAEGCPEKLDWAFIQWIWKFPEHTRPEQMRIVEAHRASMMVHVLRSRREVRRWLTSIPTARRTTDP